MTASITNEKIVLNFGWKGPNSWRGGSAHGGLDVKVIDLIFKNAQTRISINIPNNISSSTVQKLPFTCRKSIQETHPDSLKVTIEQIRNLTIKAGIFEESPNQGSAVMDSSGKITREKRLLRSDREIQLKVPEELEIGKTYNLVVTSNDFSFTAQLLKEEGARKDEIKAEFQRRTKAMGEALVTEGIQNLHLAANGGGGVFGSSSSRADIFAHAMGGIICSGQQMHPEIRVPNTKPSESLSDLDKLTPSELQARFEVTLIKDKKLEAQRMRAALAGNTEEMNQILVLEHENSQLLMNLSEALEKRGITPQIPQSESFQVAVRESEEAQMAALKNIAEGFKE